MLTFNSYTHCVCLVRVEEWISRCITHAQKTHVRVITCKLIQMGILWSSGRGIDLCGY